MDEGVDVPLPSKPLLALGFLTIGFSGVEPLLSDDDSAPATAAALAGGSEPGSRA